MMLALYYALLLLWPLLLWPALRSRGWPRWWLAAVAVLGLAALINEVRISLGPPAAIRIDIPLIGLALGLLYGSALLVLIVARWRRTAALLGLLLLLAGGGLLYGWIGVLRETERSRALIEAGDRLLFEARFRGPMDYEATFGMAAAGSPASPAGHWVPADPDQTRYSRLIVNPAGRAWLFYRCGETECHYGPEETASRAGADSGNTWQTVVTHRALPPLTLKIEAQGADRIALTIDGRTVALTRKPPPIDPAPAPETLTSLGAFSTLACDGKRRELRQLWLWQEDDQLYAVALAQTVPPGQRADFLHPIVLGVGDRQGEGWSFAWERNGLTWNARVELKGPLVELDYERASWEPDHFQLTRGAIVRDEAVALAPRTSRADWERWFEAVLVGRFASGEIPACP